MTEDRLREIIQEELAALNEGSYESKQMDYAEEGHDWTYKITVQFRGTKDHSKWLSLSQEQFRDIRNILKKGS